MKKNNAIIVSSISLKNTNLKLGFDYCRIEKTDVKTSREFPGYVIINLSAAEIQEFKKNIELYQPVLSVPEGTVYEPI